MNHKSLESMRSARSADEELDRLFRKARSHNAWLPKSLDDDVVTELYELVKWGPTAANSSPGRFVFVRTDAAKKRLAPHLWAGNVEKTLSAPCCVIVAYDSLFYDLLPELFPAREMRSVFLGNEVLIEDTAKRNSTLQGAYLIMAARALGLDCGPMSGFHNDTLDAEFFPDGRWKSNFLCALGNGSDVNLYPRSPRLKFSDACLNL